MTTITIIENGPAIITMDVESGEGTFITGDTDKMKGFRSYSRKPVPICRCGKAKVQPFCDGSHKTKTTEIEKDKV